MKKRAFALLVTLGILMILVGVVYMFLQKSKEGEKSFKKEIAYFQSSVLVQDFSEFVKQFDIKEDALIYAAQFPFSMEFGELKVDIKFEPKEKKVNLNNFIGRLEDKSIKYFFYMFLKDKELKEPDFFINLLLDAKDTDMEERDIGLRSEIALFVPAYSQGAINTKIQLEELINYYVYRTKDEGIYEIDFLSFFDFDSPAVDFNFITEDVLKLLLQKTSVRVPSNIGEKTYTKMSQVPFNDDEKEMLEKGASGTPVTFESKDVVFRLITTASYYTCESSFYYNLKNKTVSRIRIENIQVED